MAYAIRPADKSQAGAIGQLLIFAIGHSRFTANVVVERGKVCLENVRLREARPYHGCFSGPPVTALRKVRNSKHLHGGDWVAVNDMVNDVLDTHEIVAEVSSSVCHIRYGLARRIEYLAAGRGFTQHGQAAVYSAGQAPRSEVEPGTLGDAKTWIDSARAI